MAVALDLVAELERLIGHLDAEWYALCGGLAVAIHGHPRMTLDIDLLIARPHLPSVRACATRAGFNIPARPMVFGAGTSREVEIVRVSKLDEHDGDLLPLDLIIVTPVLQPAWDDRIDVAWRGHTVPMVSRAGLIAMKRVSNRPQDLVDIALLERGPDAP